MNKIKIYKTDSKINNIYKVLNSNRFNNIAQYLIIFLMKKIKKNI
jgi:hypothetical protein